MPQDQLRDPLFAKKAIETAVMLWQPPLLALPPPVPLPQEVTIVNELAMVPFRPAIAISSSPSLLALGKSALKRAVEYVVSILPESYAGTYSGESSGEGSSSKKQKKK